MSHLFENTFCRRFVSKHPRNSSFESLIAVALLSISRKVFIRGMPLMYICYILFKSNMLVMGYTGNMKDFDCRISWNGLLWQLRTVNAGSFVIFSI